MSTEIVYPSERYFKSFHDALSTVAKERIYIEMIEAPSLEKVSSFQSSLISKNGPVYYAINNDRVVGWCDVFPDENPRQNHRGGLGMGLLPEFRGQGLGSKLLSAVLDHAKKFGLEKVELNVYTSNTPAVARTGLQRDSFHRFTGTRGTANAGIKRDIFRLSIG